ncbi:KEOPS complex subunit Cgi121 [Thermococcus aggregans]|uniref:KEOPS complex subunit Cgi121 n=1 Tax=Thermococcus aggregans TaxID=110163 RepID=A0A9E7MZ23_THEAG|nr:KEOPS complex subunit Cgi121 [Thermococcus aggregans]USS41361.1 KEOPS complex subunit Cgi121 [Thermococcus aggregans]
MKVLNYGTIKIAVARILLEDTSNIFEILPDNVQILNLECWEHAVFSTILALRSFERSTNKAKTIKGEILLRASGTLQIKDAIEAVGAKKGENFIVAFGENAEKDLHELLSKIPAKEIPFGDCEKEYVKKLFEKAALVDVR